MLHAAFELCSTHHYCTLLNEATEGHIYIYISFSREPSIARRLKFAVQTSVLILAHRPLAQWLPHRIQPFIGSSLVESPFSHSKKRTHAETTANQRREATHSRGQIQFRLQDALDPRNTRQLFSPGGAGTAQCPPEEHTSTNNPNPCSKEQESSAQDK